MTPKMLMREAARLHSVHEDGDPEFLASNRVHVKASCTASSNHSVATTAQGASKQTCQSYQDHQGCEKITLLPST